MGSVRSGYHFNKKPEIRIVKAWACIDGNKTPHNESDEMSCQQFYAALSAWEGEK